jgi:hypothetical protein
MPHLATARFVPALMIHVMQVTSNVEREDWKGLHYIDGMTALFESVRECATVTGTCRASCFLALPVLAH